MNIERKLPIHKYYFLRKIDELGRIVIPIEFRKELKLNENDNIKLSINESSFDSNLDEIGRIKVPLDIRNKYDIKYADELKIYIENGNIVLENKYIE